MEKESEAGAWPDLSAAARRAGARGAEDAARTQARGERSHVWTKDRQTVRRVRSGKHHAWTRGTADRCGPRCGGRSCGVYEREKCGMTAGISGGGEVAKSDPAPSPAAGD